MHVTAAEELAALLLDELTASVSSFSANASIDELGQRATTSATLNIPEAEGSSGTNLKNQHFMKKVLSCLTSDSCCHFSAHLGSPDLIKFYF